MLYKKTQSSICHFYVVIVADKCYWSWSYASWSWSWHLFWLTIGYLALL